MKSRMKKRAGLKNNIFGMFISKAHMCYLHGIFKFVEHINYFSNFFTGTQPWILQSSSFKSSKSPLIIF